MACLSKKHPAINWYRGVHFIVLAASIVGILCLKIGFAYLIKNNPVLSEVALLVDGLAPILFGILIIPISVAILFSFFICKVEKIFSNEDTSIVPKTSRKDKWRILDDYLISKITHSLSLKEHSPPTFYFS